mgnify:FL=1|jgi:DNA processing protein
MYTKEEMIIFSILYSEIIQGRFVRQKYDSELLYLVLKNSINENINIFKDSGKNLILEKAGKEYIKTYPKKDLGKRMEIIENLFSNFDYDKYMKKAKEELYLAEENNIKIVTLLDKNYPKNLKELSVPPFVIYYKGYFPKDSELERSLAIIGTRTPDKKYGNRIAKNLGEILFNKGWWNISGLATGCDEYGHIGSLGATGAILGQGLATDIFPEKNRELARKIIENNGFLMSELPPSTKSVNIYFILRNRLQSGLTKGIFVVETSDNSGTLHTVKYSLEQGRETYVLDVREVADLRREDVVKGNIKLLDKNEKIAGNVTISKKLKENIIGIKKLRDFEDILIGKEKRINLSLTMEKREVQEKLW